MPGYYRFKLNRVKPLQLFTNMDANDYRDDFPLYGLRRYAMPWAVEQVKRRYLRNLPVMQDTDASAAVEDRMIGTA
jgi:hypothetical protein